MSVIRLSHSARETFNQCPRKYQLHYIEKIRPTYESSPLFFGGAFDEALNAILLRKKKNLNQEEQYLVECSPYEIFDDHFTNKRIAGEMVDLRTDLRANFYNSDFSENFMEAEDEAELLEFMKLHSYEETDPKKLRNSLFSAVKETGYQTLDLIDRSFLNYCKWLSLRRKGHAMIAAYEEKLLPKIQEVISIQRRINIEGDGVTVTGLVDFEAILDDGKKYTVDNKTSSRPYKDDAVETSPQLATYNYITQYGRAAYFVVQKKPRIVKVKTCQICGVSSEGREKTCKEGGKNRCGGEFDIIERVEIKVQDIRGEISSELEDATLQGFEETCEAIDSGEFPENREEDCRHFGQKCPYYDLCRNGSMKGLKEKTLDI